MAASPLLMVLPNELFEKIVGRLPPLTCIALAATCTSLSKECALRARINRFLEEAEVEFEAAREREAKSWFPNEGTGDMSGEEGARDWSEDEF